MTGGAIAVLGAVPSSSAALPFCPRGAPPQHPAPCAELAVGRVSEERGSDAFKMRLARPHLRRRRDSCVWVMPPSGKMCSCHRSHGSMSKKTSFERGLQPQSLGSGRRPWFCAHWDSPSLPCHSSQSDSCATLCAPQCDPLLCYLPCCSQCCFLCWISCLQHCSPSLATHVVALLTSAPIAPWFHQTSGHVSIHSKPAARRATRQGYAQHTKTLHPEPWDVGPENLIPKP